MSKYLTKKRKNRRRKTRRVKKGGFLFNQDLKFAGIDLSRQTGKKQYNWKTGKWDNLVCYGIGPFKGCKVEPAE